MKGVYFKGRTESQALATVSWRLVPAPSLSPDSAPTVCPSTQQGDRGSLTGWKSQGKRVFSCQKSTENHGRCHAAGNHEGARGYSGQTWVTALMSPVGAADVPKEA